MITNNLKKMRNRLDALRADNLAEVEKVNAQIESARQMLEEANAAAADAYARADLKSYHKAGDDRRTAEDTIEMFETKLCQLETEPLISEAEYKDGIAAVMAELDAILASAKTAMLPIFEQAQKIKADMSEAISFGDSILHDWQHDVFRDDACAINSKGEKVYRRYNEIEFDRGGSKRSEIIWLVSKMSEYAAKWTKE